MQSSRQVNWLVSYPKSGNTWLRWLLSCYQAGRPLGINALAPIASPASRALVDRCLGIAHADLLPLEARLLRIEALRRYLNSEESLACFKVHEALRESDDDLPILPAGFDHRLVLLVRDPRAIAVSYSEFTSVTVDRAIQWMGDTEHKLPVYDAGMTYEIRVHLGSWSWHTRSWAEAENALILRYEDLHLDPRAALRRVLDHLGMPLDPGRIEMAIEACQFDQARREESSDGFSESLPGRRFFRQGAVAAWVDRLSAEQQARLVSEHGTWMQKLGYAA